MASTDPAFLPRRMTSPREVARLAEGLAALVEQTVRGPLSFLSAECDGDLAARARDAVTAFPALYERRPVLDNKGGSGFNDSLWLYSLACMLAPERIVELGSFKGHSAWLFRQACPDAAIDSFDVDTQQRVHDAAGVRFHRGDWSESEIAAKPSERALLFLDDHISHARRLREAHARGFRVLLLDDNFPADQLYATGGPPVPTLAMILDASLTAPGEIAWTRNGKAYRCRVDPGELAAARNLIAQAVELPELAPLTRYPLGSRLTLTKLVD